jgi:hypothetical protein
MQFYKSYFINIEQEIFAVLTDSFRKPGFKLHALVGGCWEKESGKLNYTLETGIYFGN